MASKLTPVIMFSPEHWGEVERFQKFFSQSTQLTNDEQEVVSGVANHLRKANSLLSVATAIAPNLDEDEREMDEKGYSRGIRAAEFSAVVESALTAIYSSLDCMRKILNILYPKAQGLPQSTRKTFKSAADGKIDAAVPQNIREALAQAEWFTSLRIARDALTHTNTGSCSRDRETGKIRYFSNTFQPIKGQTYIDDFLGFVFEIRDLVNRFLGRVFRELNKGLKDVESWQMCGVFDARIYHRFVRPSEAKDFNSGRCGAFEWFDLPENPTCPFKQFCGAYARRSGV